MSGNWFMDTVDGYLGMFDPYRQPLDNFLEKLTIPITSFNRAFDSVTMKNPDQTILFTVKLLSFLLAVFSRRVIPARFHRLKFLANFIFGIMVVASIFKCFVALLLTYALLGYIFTLVIPAKYNRFFTFLVMMSICFGVCYYEQTFHQNEIRYGYCHSVMQMTLKLITIPFCMYDGDRLKRSEKKSDSKEKKKVSSVQRRFNSLALKKRPKLLHYLSYVFFPGNVTSPPPFEFKHYYDSIVIEENQTRPIDWKAIGGRMGWWVLYLAMIMIWTSVLGVFEHSLKMEHSSDYTFWQLLYTPLLVNSLLAAKFQWIGLTSEIVCIAGGIGHTPENESEQWDHVKCCNPWLFEFGASMQTKIKGWNVGVDRWMRYYFYFRLPRGMKLFNRMATGFLAALWHGKYLGVFFFFLFMQVIGDLYSVLQRRLKVDKWKRGVLFYLAQALLIVFSWCLGHFTTSFFWLQTWDEIKAYHGQLYYAYFILIVAAFVVRFVI